MAIVSKEIIADASARDSGTGPELSRGFHVTGLTGDESGRLIDALNQPKIPKLGSVHPKLGTLFAVERSATMADANQARVIVTYRVPKADAGEPTSEGGDLGKGAPGVSTKDKGTISVGASNSTREVFRDVTGKLMTVGTIIEVDKKVTDPKTGTETTVSVKEADIQLRSAQIIEPNVILSVSRVESGSPDQKAREFVGTINSKPLGGKIKASGLGVKGADPPGTWLCTRITGTSNDGGSTYNVQYEFQYQPNGWHFLASYINKKTGQPLFVGLTDAGLTGEENISYAVYESKDFHKLGITFVGAIAT
jgi:hypothetical protein